MALSSSGATEAAAPASGFPSVSGQQTYVAALLEVVRELGIAPRTLLAEVRRQLPEQTTPDLMHLCAAACRLSDDPTLGLRVGARLDLTSHGILGYALMSSSTVDQALQRLLRYIGLTAPLITLRRVLDGPRCLLLCHPSPTLQPQQFYLDAALTSILVSAGTLFGPRVAAEGELWLQGPAPAHASAYTTWAAVKVRFDAPHNAAMMPRKYLGAPVRSADPLLEELCRKQCEDLLLQMRRRHGLAGQLREHLLLNAGEFPTLPEVAARLGQSERNLRRRLADEGTSWRQLLDEVRLQLARGYLADTQLPIAEVAHLLGYDDVANFRRAFRRLQGQAPVTFRQQMQRR